MEGDIWITLMTMVLKSRPVIPGKLSCVYLNFPGDTESLGFPRKVKIFSSYFSVCLRTVGETVGHRQMFDRCSMCSAYSYPL